MGPLATIAHQLGHRVSGSDLKESGELATIRAWQPAVEIHLGQTAEQIEAAHQRRPIDWYVYSSALEWAEPPNQELAWVKRRGLRHSKRDQFLNYLLEDNGLRLLAVTGSHGKTTTTAMMIWLCRQLGEEVSYAIGGRLAGWPAARLSRKSPWFVYEADEFDRNFLAFRPRLSLITGLDHDHPESFPKWRDYQTAFWQFIAQSERTVIGRHSAKRLGRRPAGLAKTELTLVTSQPPDSRLRLAGRVNRENASLALAGARIALAGTDEKRMISALNSFPGSWRRFEQIAAGIYSDYAHNPVKIAGCLQRAFELGKPVVAVYEPHSNQRQHLVRKDYRKLFGGVEKVYWLPTFLSREDPSQKLLSAEELIAGMGEPRLAEPAQMDEALAAKIRRHAAEGAVVVAMTAGDLDAWMRRRFGDKRLLRF